MKKNLSFELNQSIVITATAQKGTVLGRAEYTNAEETYYVSYVSAQGNLCKEWFNGSDLSAAS